MGINLSQLIAPSFYAIHNDIKKGKHTEYWLSGGRASTKSSFVSVEIIQGMLQDPNANAIAIRQVKDTTSESVYEQLLWAIDKLGLSSYWICTKNPERMIYKPTGQRIIFRGMDKVEKLKSTKVHKGYLKYIWYEELTEMKGMEFIRNVNQSLMRGGDKFCIFYSYNPPASSNNWVNAERLIPNETRLVHHSTYLTVPKEWLGEPFIIMAEHLKKTNYDKYRHEYLGEVTGTGAEVFTNLTVRKITNEELAEFYNISRGLDFGFAQDPTAYIVNHYDTKKKRLYLFYEFYKISLSNAKMFEMIKVENENNDLIYADSAEPRTIAEGQAVGIKMVGVKKGPDSVDFGIKWLQDLEEIIIDPVRCPNATKEFTEYALEPDGNGGFKAKYPDKQNHLIDATRYSRSADMTRNKIKSGIKITSI